MTRTVLDPKHGSRQGYNWHMRRGVALCIPCREWKRQEQVEILKDPVKRARKAQMVVANRKAKSRLASEFPDLYRRYYLEELANLSGGQ